MGSEYSWAGIYERPFNSELPNYNVRGPCKSPCTQSASGHGTVQFTDSSTFFCGSVIFICLIIKIGSWGHVLVKRGHAWTWDASRLWTQPKISFRFRGSDTWSCPEVHLKICIVIFRCVKSSLRYRHQTVCTTSSWRLRKVRTSLLMDFFIRVSLLSITKLTH